jgi:hypothetical protein
LPQSAVLLGPINHPSVPTMVRRLVLVRYGIEIRNDNTATKVVELKMIDSFSSSSSYRRSCRSVNARFEVSCPTLIHSFVAVFLLLRNDIIKSTRKRADKNDWLRTQTAAGWINTAAAGRRKTLVLVHLVLGREEVTRTVAVIG